MLGRLRYLLLTCLVNSAAAKGARNPDNDPAVLEMPYKTAANCGDISAWFTMTPAPNVHPFSATAAVITTTACTACSELKKPRATHKTAGPKPPEQKEKFINCN